MLRLSKASLRVPLSAGGAVGGLHALTLQGNQLSYGTVGALREHCNGNKSKGAVEAHTTGQVSRARRRLFQRSSPSQG